MRKLAGLLIALAVLAAGCSDDGTGTDTTAAEAALTADERSWCSFADATEESAFRFDQIFEAGLALGLPMDALNARASAWRLDYTEEGMTNAEAVAAVSGDLQRDDVFIAACKEAYAVNVG